jgi:N6-L-threonylcarbamoyladenine synthase
MLNSGDYDFSFSGLKTAVRNLIQNAGELTDVFKRSLARELEDAVTDVIVTKTKRAIDEFGVATLIVGGCVIANAHIREALEGLARDENGRLRLLLPTRELSTDNAVMIGMAGYIRYMKTPERYVPYDTKNDVLRAMGTMRIEATR